MIRITNRLWADTIHCSVIRPSRISFGGISFGGTAAIVTSMALIAGLDAAQAGRAGVVSALLIAAVADNLTDSLSVHMYQESERLEQKDAFVGTLSNFGTRLIVVSQFRTDRCDTTEPSGRLLRPALGNVPSWSAHVRSWPLPAGQRGFRGD